MKEWAQAKKAPAAGASDQDGLYLAEPLLGHSHRVHGMVRPLLLEHHGCIVDLPDRPKLVGGDPLDKHSFMDLADEIHPVSCPDGGRA